MKRFLPISYRDFCDVPRMFVVSDGESTYLLECRFDEGLDEFPPHYNVCQMPGLAEIDLDGSWEDLSKRAVRRLGQVSVSDVQFDETRRRKIDGSILEQFQRQNDSGSTKMNTE